MPKPMTDYTDPSTIDVDEVMANIDQSFRVRSHLWTDKPVWPNVTVKALADEVRRLRALTDEGEASPDPYEAQYRRNMVLACSISAVLLAGTIINVTLAALGVWR